jgi:hypothetical protein
MHRANLLIVTALLEMGTALLLLSVPALPLTLLLDVSEAAPETLLISRVAGSALLAIGAACWLARNGEPSDAQIGLLIGILIYDGAAAALLAYASIGLGMMGIALWPAVGVDTSLGVWCCLSLRVKTEEVKPAK